jgi:hypothetical protein
MHARSLRLPDGVVSLPFLASKLGAYCDVCNLDEDYADNPFVLCDKCGIFVHMECYNVSAFPDGSLWLCKVCALGLEVSPPCAVCPAMGGAMMRTTCRRWCHNTCAMWVPELSFSAAPRLEPIDGAQRIPKARANLKCQVCQQVYGACIQCTTAGCYAAYHPLCARRAGYQMQVRDQPTNTSTLNTFTFPFYDVYMYDM